MGGAEKKNWWRAFGVVNWWFLGVGGGMIGWIFGTGGEMGGRFFGVFGFFSVGVALRR